ncbi:MAG TPA: glycosyltransferase [Acidimicrobiia bacterium]|nr:glycosyltransferase [Acidimicrobiia bacterium]
MIRVLSIQPFAERGGSDHALVRMVRSLPRASFTCHVVVPAPHPLARELADAGAAVHVVAMGKISRAHTVVDWLRYAARWPLVVARLVRMIRVHRIDVVHTNVLHGWHGWAAASLTRRPHVWHAREVVTQSTGALALERFLTRHFATVVVAVSQTVADQLPRSPTRVVHDLPDPGEFTPERAGRARTALGIDDAAPCSGAIGRLDPIKGLDVLLDAWPAVRDALPDARLVVVGGTVAGHAAHADLVRARCAALAGVVTAFDADADRLDVADLVADLDALVLASVAPEGFGLVLVEALTSGCPVVATDSGGPEEIAALAAPGAARLVPPGDADALASALVATLAARTATDSAARRLRPRLLEPYPPDYAAVFTDAVARRRRAAS